MEAKTKNGRTLKIGTKVAYSVDFLKSIGESHGPMAHARGEIVAFKFISDDCILAKVSWADDKVRRFKAPISYTSLEVLITLELNARAYDDDLEET